MHVSTDEFVNANVVICGLFLKCFMLRKVGLFYLDLGLLSFLLLSKTYWPTIACALGAFKNSHVVAGGCVLFDDFSKFYLTNCIRSGLDCYFCLRQGFISLFVYLVKNFSMQVDHLNIYRNQVIDSGGSHASLFLVKGCS